MKKKRVVSLVCEQTSRCYIYNTNGPYHICDRNLSRRICRRKRMVVGSMFCQIVYGGDRREDLNISIRQIITGDCRPVATDAAVSGKNEHSTSTS